jgi:hypothetical protein
MNTWKSPLYNPDTRKNPNSPVAHQPNVSYDHRIPNSPFGQGQAQGQYQGYHSHRPPQHSQQQQYQYQPYVPPQSYSTASWKAQPATSGPARLDEIDQYAQLSQHGKTLPLYPYAQSPRQLPPSPYSQGAGQAVSPTYGTPGRETQALSQGHSSISSMLSNPTGTPKPPMYAITPSSNVIYAAQSPVEYLDYVKSYPYLRNCYLRRTKTYFSPYSPDGGIAPEWMPKPPMPRASTTSTAIAPRPIAPTRATPQGYHHGSPSTGLPVPRPSAQFQSPDAFQREMARSTQTPEAPKWEQMLKQLATSTGPTGMPSVTASQAPQPRYPPSSSRSGLPCDLPRSMQASQTPPQAQPQRPTPSPISDDGKDGSVAEQKPAMSSLQPAPPVHGAETWRYS